SATETVRCLREGLFRLAFQPVIEAKTRTPVFHEALLRMVDPAGEVITAVHLIPIAEKLGLVRLIDRAVAQMVVASLHKYSDARLSLNLSGTTATDPRWYPQIIEMLASNRAVTDRLTIEITETVALGDLHETVRFVEQLRELGCRVAIDDFGAGFTSFRNLRALPIDMLKLDGTFCRDLAGNGDNTYFVRSLIDMARTFNIQTVAEWVESEEDAVLLRDWGIDLMQGNLFGEAILQAPWPAAKEAAAAGARSPFVLPSEIEWDSALAETPVLREEDLASLPAEPAEAAAPWNPVSEPAASVTDSGTSADSPEDGATKTVVQSFEHALSGELSKLRDAISALDQALKGDRSAKAAEPSFADLVSDTARRATG
ncbi:MAG: EAL domain-containing protein, partial [Hyphomicrobiales bacterium]